MQREEREAKGVRALGEEVQLRTVGKSEDRLARRRLAPDAIDHSGIGGGHLAVDPEPAEARQRVRADQRLALAAEHTLVPDGFPGVVDDADQDEPDHERGRDPGCEPEPSRGGEGHGVREIDGDLVAQADERVEGGYQRQRRHRIARPAHETGEEAEAVGGRHKWEHDPVEAVHDVGETRGGGNQTKADRHQLPVAYARDEREPREPQRSHHRVVPPGGQGAVPHVIREQRQRRGERARCKAPDEL